MTRLILDSKNTILLERPPPPPASPDCKQIAGALSVMYITDSAGRAHFFSCVCFGKVKSEARSNQLITFTRFFYEALPITYRDLPAAALNHACAFQLAGSIRDGWPLNT
jgi:hypothetical protein